MGTKEEYKKKWRKAYPASPKSYDAKTIYKTPPDPIVREIITDVKVALISGVFEIGLTYMEGMPLRVSCKADRGLTFRRTAHNCIIVGIEDEDKS